MLSLTHSNGWKNSRGELRFVIHHFTGIFVGDHWRKARNTMNSLHTLNVKKATREGETKMCTIPKWFGAAECRFWKITQHHCYSHSPISWTNAAAACYYFSFFNIVICACMYPFRRFFFSSLHLLKYLSCSSDWPVHVLIRVIVFVSRLNDWHREHTEQHHTQPLTTHTIAANNLSPKTKKYTAYFFYYSLSRRCSLHLHIASVWVLCMLPPHKHSFR